MNLLALVYYNGYLNRNWDFNVGKCEDNEIHQFKCGSLK